MASTPRPTTPGRPRRLARDLTAVLDAIAAIEGALRLASKTVERDLAISGAQLFVLQKLAEAPVESLNELASRTFTHQSTVSTVVARLAARGLVRRTASPEDARRLVIGLTPAGRSLLRRAPEPLQARLIVGVSRLSARERRSLARGLDKLVREAGIRAGAPPMMFLDAEPLRPRLARGDRRRRS